MKKLKKFVPVLLLLVLLFPVMVFAAAPCPSGTHFDFSSGGCVADAPGSGTTSCDTVTGIGNLICRLQQLLNSILPLLLLLGIVYFVWGVVQYVIGGGEEAKKKGKDRIIYGLIGLAVILSLAGLINVLVTTFGFNGQSLTVPNLVPTTTSAAAGGTCDVGTTFQTLMGYAVCVINNSVIPLLFAVAIAFFIWGAVKFFIINADEEAKREQGKQFMIWGIIAIAVMMSVWGLVTIFRGTFDKNGSTSNLLPQACPPGSNQCPH